MKDPSGHGIRSSLWAALLGEIFPEHAAGYQTRALETRRFKLISGAHYPSDIVAGQVLGEAVARAMLQNPAVRKKSRSCARKPRLSSRNKRSGQLAGTNVRFNCWRAR